MEKDMRTDEAILASAGGLEEVRRVLTLYLDARLYSAEFSYDEIEAALRPAGDLLAKLEEPMEVTTTK